MWKTCTAHTLFRNVDPLHETNMLGKREENRRHSGPSACKVVVKIVGSDVQWFVSLSVWNRTLQYVMEHFEVDGAGHRARTIAPTTV